MLFLGPVVLLRTSTLQLHSNDPPTSSVGIFSAELTQLVCETQHKILFQDKFLRILHEIISCGTAGAYVLVEEVVNPVSYTHLTLPTKRIV